MPRPMRKYEIKKPKIEKISFVANSRNFGHKEYHEYGRLKTYANKTQADKKISELKLLGYSTVRKADRPYTIILDEIGE